MLSSKHKPNTLNFKDFNLPTSGQFTPSTPTVISLLQDLTPTNYGYNFDISDKDDVMRLVILIDYYFFNSLTFQAVYNALQVN